MYDAILLVQTNCTSGHEAEFEQWYIDTHLHDVTAMSAFAAATLHKNGKVPLHRDQPAPEAKFNYVAIYEIDGDPHVAAMQLADKRAQMELSPYLEAEKWSIVYRRISERVTQDTQE